MTAPNEHVAPGEPGYHGHAAPAHADHAVPVLHFSDKELAQFHADDYAAGRAVVILMLGIFSTGVFIYSVVAYWVINFSHA